MMEEDRAKTLLESVIPFFLRGGAITAGLAAIVIGLLYVKQDQMLYFPEIGGIPRKPNNNPRKYRSPGEHMIPFESHQIRCEDGVAIHSWLLLQRDSKAKDLPTLIFFHGNAGNIGLRLPNAIQMYQYLKVNILMVEYRGYGDSDDAKPDEKGFKLDAEASLEFIRKHPEVDPSRIFIFGRSIGGAVGFHLAKFAEQKNIPLAGVIVENTFVSIPRMVDHLMPYIAPLKSLILRIGWDSGKIVPSLRSPVLYLAGSDDELVPHSHMLELFKASSKVSRCARIHVIKGGGHNDTWMKGAKEYWDSIRRFMEEAHSCDSGSGNESFIKKEVIEEWNHHSATNSINMGGDSAQQQQVIPIMPSDILGIAKEATGGSTSIFGNKAKKKES